MHLNSELMDYLWHTSFNVENTEEAIVTPRNKLAHNQTAFPSDEETDLLLSKVEECLAFYHKSYY